MPSYRAHFCAEGRVQSGDAFAADVVAVIDALLIASARIRLARVGLRLAARACETCRAVTLEAAHPVQARAAVQARARLAFVVLEITLRSAEACPTGNTFS